LSNKILHLAGHPETAAVFRETINKSLHNESARSAELGYKLLYEQTKKTAATAGKQSRVLQPQQGRPPETTGKIKPIIFVNITRILIL
jgi:hypothetical protein